MDTASVVRWQRYGHDRLYVTGEDGTRLGWHDLTTDHSTVQQPERAAEFHTAVAGWRARSTAGTTPPQVPEQQPALPRTAAPAPVTSARAPDVAAPGADLAGRPAGAAAREQAVALRQAAPVRTLLARVLGVRTRERAWRIGADGEEKVAAQLAKLKRADPRWRVLHAIKVGTRGSDIDHLVMGPGGVFALNAKHHPGAAIWVAGDTFLVNGTRQPYLRNSRHEATRAARLLTAVCRRPVEVTGVVVLVGARDVTIKAAPTDTHVITRTGLAGWLGRRANALDQEAVEAVFEAARRSTTWQPH